MLISIIVFLAIFYALVSIRKQSGAIAVLYQGYAYWPGRKVHGSVPDDDRRNDSDHDHGGRTNPQLAP